MSAVCCLVLLWCCRGGWAACKATRWWALQWWCWVSLVCCLGLLWCCRGGWAACRATMWWALQWWCQRGALQRQQKMLAKLRQIIRQGSAVQATNQAKAPAEQAQQAAQPLRDLPRTLRDCWHGETIVRAKQANLLAEE